jgi:hypothetical protein
MLDGWDPLWMRALTFCSFPLFSISFTIKFAEQLPANSSDYSCFPLSVPFSCWALSNIMWPVTLLAVFTLMVLFAEHTSSSVFHHITQKEIIRCWHTIYIRQFRLWLHMKAVFHVEPIVNQWDPFFTFCFILQEKQQLITLSEYIWLDVSTSGGFTEVFNCALIISSGSNNSIGMLHICHLSSPGTISGKLQTVSWAMIPSVMAWMRY